MGNDTRHFQVDDGQECSIQYMNRTASVKCMYLKVSLLHFCNSVRLLCCQGFARPVFQYILPSLLGSFLDESLHPETLDVHVGHGGVACSSAGLSEHSARLPAVLVTHNLHGVLLN